jgi:hypothetical protein
MPPQKSADLDAALSSDPLLLAEFVLYVYFQNTPKVADSEIKASVETVLGSGERPAGEDLLASNLREMLFGNKIQKHSFTPEAARDALKKLLDMLNAASGSGHRYLDEMVIRNYPVFRPVLVGTYSRILKERSVYASIDNHFQAEAEIYRACSFVFPGTADRAGERFDSMYSGPEQVRALSDPAVREMEFLQWFNSRYVIPAVELLPPEWYSAEFRQSMSDRVRPIFDSVLNQRNSLFTVTRFRKNSALFNDVISNEDFTVRLQSGAGIPSNGLMECTLIRHANSFNLNSLLKLIPDDQAEQMKADMLLRRRVMAEAVRKFSELHGTQTLLFPSLHSAIAAYDDFVNALGYPEKGEIGHPLLLNSEVFRQYPGYRAALLCEENNLYISLHYPLLLDVMNGSVRGRDAVEIVTSCFENRIALPFTSLKRLFGEKTEALLAALRVAYSNLKTADEMRTFIERARNHSWEYSPLPLFSRPNSLLDHYVLMD